MSIVFEETWLVGIGVSQRASRYYGGIDLVGPCLGYENLYFK